jgi:hypothetical protein
VGRTGEPAPVGVPGELCIAGDGVALGYLGRPELTAERFVPEPASLGAGTMYRTGDLCAWRADGTLEYLGRLDFQVKVRGHRIELGEIEATLLQHASLREAVVVAQGEGADKRLVAYVVAKREGEAPSAEALRNHLRERLPEYMLPGAFVPLARLPLSPNGKVDRKALPAPDQALAPARAFVAPRTAMEELVAGTFADVLGAARVGAHDHFFELGGHSLLAIVVQTRLTERVQMDVPLRLLFDHPTVEGFAAALEEALTAQLEQELGALSPEELARLDADAGKEGRA